MPGCRDGPEDPIHARRGCLLRGHLPNGPQPLPPAARAAAQRGDRWRSRSRTAPLSARENLVARPQDWPGVHCVTALLTGEPIRRNLVRSHAGMGSAAARRGARCSTVRGTETVSLAPLPCWRDLSAEQYRKRIAEFVEAIIAKAAARRAETESSPSAGPPSSDSTRSLSRPRSRDRPRRSSKPPANGFGFGLAALSRANQCTCFPPKLQTERTMRPLSVDSLRISRR